MNAPIMLEVRIDRLRGLINRRLGELTATPAPTPLSRAISHALLAPGKRVRPLLVLLAAEAVGGEEAAALDPACAIEMVHAASLILDDLPCMDDDDERRGQPATHKVFGEAVAVLAAVALLNEAYAVIARAPGLPAAVRLQMTEVLADAVGRDGLVAGQDEDLRRGEVIAFDSLSEIHQRKTGVLFSASVRIGGLAALADVGAVDALSDFGSQLGLAFQALDDLQEEASDAGMATVVSLLGREGARDEAERRLGAAKAALARGGDGLQRLGGYVDLMLKTA